MMKLNTTLLPNNVKKKKKLLNENIQFRFIYLLGGWLRIQCKIFI